MMVPVTACADADRGRETDGARTGKVQEPTAHTKGCFRSSWFLPVRHRRSRTSNRGTGEPQNCRLRDADGHISYAAPTPQVFRVGSDIATCPSSRLRPRGTRHQTKQEFVYRTLRKALLACEFQPGERLVIDDLARRLGVSIIPVREALQMLQAEGLVVNVPHVGAAAAPLSRESIVDVFSVLEGLEVVATRLLAERGSPDAVRALEPIVRGMDKAATWRDATKSGPT